MQIPPLPALRAFEAAARHLSFTQAGGELGMTQSAISYQIRVLEERLGAALFLRKSGGVELTDLGQRLSQQTSEAFDILRNAYSRPQEGGGTLTISAVLSFSANWLGQRLGRFQIANPDLAVRLDTTDRVVDFAREDIDIAIRHGKGNWPGLEAYRLIDAEVAPLLSPALRDLHGPLVHPADLIDLPWIDPNDPKWVMWLNAAGVPHIACPPRPSAQLESQITESRAALAGEGVALLTPRFFQFELATGSLIRPFDPIITTGNAFWLVCPPSRRNRPAIRAFRQFLTTEIVADAASVPVQVPVQA